MLIHIEWRGNPSVNKRSLQLSLECKNHQIEEDEHKRREEEIGRLKYHLLLSILFERPLEEKTQQAHTIIKNCTLSVLLEKKTIFTNILKNIER